MANLVKKIKTASGDAQIDYNALANLPTISNPNLLINSDFRKPVNQRGNTSYTGTGANIRYTIDRWGVVNGPVVTVQDGSLKIQVSSNDTYTGRFKQIFEHDLPIDFYTLSVKVKSNTHNVEIGNFGKINAGFTGIYSHTSIERSLSSIEFVIGKGASIEIEWIKLERGTTATPLSPRSYAEELALCQRYYEKRTVIFFPYNGTAPSQYYIAVNGDSHRVTKRIEPNLTFSKFTDHNNADVTANLSSDNDHKPTQTKDYIRMITLASNCNNYLLRSIIEFDAEIY